MKFPRCKSKCKSKFLLIEQSCIECIARYRMMEKLWNKHIDEKKSVQQIADENGVSFTAIKQGFEMYLEQRKVQK